MIIVDNINFSYNKHNKILNNVSLKIDKGEIVNILGANGCGKSTLLKLILGFIKAQSGNIEIYSKNINNIKRQDLAKYISYVPQSHYAIFPYAVKDVVVMGRCSGIWKSYSKKDYEKVDSVLNELKIYHLKNSDYSRLSGGQRQLVMIARAVIQNAAYCFMDEPVASLDYGNQYRLLECIKKLSQNNITFVMTTHNPDHVKYLGGRAILMVDGSIYRDGAYDNVLDKEAFYKMYKVKVNESGNIYDVD